MTRFSIGRLATVVAVVSVLFTPARTEAQNYFGRNKVQYESFKWKILKSELRKPFWPDLHRRVQ